MAVNRYTRVAIILHWLIAAAVISMVPMGVWMSEAVNDPAQQQAAYRAFQLHKSIGFAILFLTAFRLVWRLLHPAPPLPAQMKTWERVSAHGVHAAFYFLLLALPLTGWLYVSTGWSAPLDQPLVVATSFFGLFQVPTLPGVADASVELRRVLAFHALGAHSTMALGGTVLFFLHAGAALKHQLIDRDGVLGHMVPWLKSRSGPSELAIAKGRIPYIAGVALALAIGLTGWFSAQPGAAPANAGGTAEASAQAVVDTSVTPGTAAAWVIDPASSSIVFSGTHAGNGFEGRFGKWEGHIWFDPDDLAGSRAVVLVNTGSAATGDATQEGSLRDGEWFDSAAFPVARFEASTFRALGGDRYEASGNLTIKGKTVAVRLPFTLVVSGGRAKAEGTVELDRTELGLGLLSDASAAWVSRMIEVKITVSAQRR